MKKLFLLSLMVSLLFSACEKTDECPYSPPTATASAAEKTAVANYVAANNTAAVAHNSGVYYQVLTPGSGESPTICSNITVKYKGTLMSNGNVFDETPASSGGISFTLGQLIAGWQHVLPVLKEGGKIIMYVPPSLGYGASDRTDANGNVVIPANSYLKFEVELVNVQ